MSSKKGATSLLALAVSRTVAAVLTPLRQLTGLAAKHSAAIISRELRKATGLLFLLVSGSVSRRSARAIVGQIDSMTTRRNRSRDDSFARLLAMLPA